MEGKAQGAAKKRSAKLFPYRLLTLFSANQCTIKLILPHHVMILYVMILLLYINNLCCHQGCCRQWHRFSSWLSAQRTYFWFI